PALYRHHRCSGSIHRRIVLAPGTVEPTAPVVAAGRLALLPEVSAQGKRLAIRCVCARICWVFAIRSFGRVISWGPMDRRTWMQLLTILATVRESASQQRGATPPAADSAGRGGRGQGGFQQQPMRIEKSHVVGALKLLGLEFQDSEVDLMMRGVN